MQIMDMPEYYLTRAELKNFREKADVIFEAFAHGQENETAGFDLIELGAGDGTKTAVLIEHFLGKNADITYSPIDISQEANDTLCDKFHTRFPGLDIKPHTGDYFRILDSLKDTGGRRKILMFLGSNIGNFQHDAALAFFRSLRGSMNADDRLFIGFDLQKDPRVILRAYDDPAGITAAFNLNLLRRINRELGGDFDLDAFLHYAVYVPLDGAARSFLISRKEQTVNISALETSFEFDQWEPIYMEISQKYTPEMIADLAADSGFSIAASFTDSEYHYANYLWRPDTTS